MTTLSNPQAGGTDGQEGGGQRGQGHDLHANDPGDADSHASNSQVLTVNTFTQTCSLLLMEYQAQVEHEISLVSCKRRMQPERNFIKSTLQVGSDPLGCVRRVLCK